MAILNVEGEYVYLNKAHAKIYGYEMPGNLLKSWRILYDSDVIQYLIKKSCLSLVEKEIGMAKPS